MLAMCFSILPIFIATVCMFCKKDSIRSLIIGIFTGIILYICRDGFSINSLNAIMTVLVMIFYNNVTVLLSIFLLLFIVYLIRHSDVLFSVNSLTEKYINSSKKVTIFLLTFGIIFSLDDYLLCISTAILLGDLAKKYGFSKEKTTFMINLTAVCCCCISPFSSWMPVIKATLINSGLQDDIIFKIIPYNYTAFLGIILVISIGMFKPFSFNSLPLSTQILQKKNETLPLQKNKSKITTFCLLFVILIGSLLSMTFIWKTNNAVIKSSLLSILIAIPLFIKTNSINKDRIAICIKDSLKSTLNLSKLLLSIWLLTSICQDLLDMDKNIVTYTSSMYFSLSYMPVIIFTLAGLFAFLTGSSYGTFGLFIPLSVQLTQNANSSITQIITISAAISGSLMAAYSLTSDTLKLTSENVNSNIRYLRIAQLPYGVSLYVSGIISFLLSSICIPYGQCYAIIIPLFTLSSLFICYFTFLSSIHKLIEKVVFKLLIYYKLTLIYHMQTTHIPYPVHNYTFHLKYAIIEQLIENKICMLIKYAFYILLISFPLKMPGL